MIDVATKVKASGRDQEMVPQFLMEVNELFLIVEGHQHLLAVSQQFSQKLKVFEKPFPATGEAEKARSEIYKRVFTLLGKK